jgi:hypothetical protein
MKKYTILALIIFWPFGLYLYYKNRNIKVITLFLLSISGILFFIPISIIALSALGSFWVFVRNYLPEYLQQLNIL